MQRLPCHIVPPKKGIAVGNDARDDLVRSAVVIPIARSRARIDEAHQTLVDRRLPNQFGARQSADPGNQSMGVPARAIDQLGDAAPAKLPQRGVGRNSTPASRPLGRPILPIAGIFEGVEGANVEVAGLQENDGRLAGLTFKGARQGGRLKTATRIAGQVDDGVLPSPRSRMARSMVP